jgi:hypothetical protein
VGRMDVPEMRLQGRQVWARARRTLKASCTLRLTGARGARGGEIDSPAPQSCRADLSSRTRLRLPCVQRTPDNLSSARRQGQRRRIRCLPFCVYGSGCFTDRRGCPLVAPVLSISGPIFFGTETLLPLKCSDRRDAKGLRLQLWLLPWCRQLARTWSLSAAPDFPTGWR